MTRTGQATRARDGDDEPAGEDEPPPSEREDADANGSTDDPNMSTEGVLDEETLRAHAREVDDSIDEARRRNG